MLQSFIVIVLLILSILFIIGFVFKICYVFTQKSKDLTYNDIQFKRNFTNLFKRDSRPS